MKRVHMLKQYEIWGLVCSESRGDCETIRRKGFRGVEGIRNYIFFFLIQVILVNS